MLKFDTQVLEISTLALETTRRCNMLCDHCLRGQAQDSDLRESILDNLLRHTAIIDNVTFSGGEPALNLHIIKRFYTLCQEYGIQVRSFFVATNGKTNQLELATILLEQYEKADWQESCSVSISRDAFHDDREQSELMTYLTFYSKTKEHNPSDFDWPMPIGMSQLNGLGERTKRVLEEEFTFFEPEYKGNVRVDTLYLSTNGYAYSDCDMSYEEQDDAISSPNDCPAEFVKCDGTVLEQLIALQKGRKLH